MNMPPAERGWPRPRNRKENERFHRERCRPAQAALSLALTRPVFPHLPSARQLLKTVAATNDMSGSKKGKKKPFCPFCRFSPFLLPCPPIKNC
jgi:hypothetical protein